MFDLRELEFQKDVHGLLYSWPCIHIPERHYTTVLYTCSMCSFIYILQDMGRVSWVKQNKSPASILLSPIRFRSSILLPTFEDSGLLGIMSYVLVYCLFLYSYICQTSNNEIHPEGHNQFLLFHFQFRTRFSLPLLVMQVTVMYTGNVHSGKK